MNPIKLVRNMAFQRGTFAEVDTGLKLKSFGPDFAAPR
jgi:hypothetical protein